MSNKFKRVVRTLSAKIGVSHQGAVNILRRNDLQPIDLFLEEVLPDGAVPIYEKDSSRLAYFVDFPYDNNGRDWEDGTITETHHQPYVMVPTFSHKNRDLNFIATAFLIWVAQQTESRHISSIAEIPVDAGIEFSRRDLRLYAFMANRRICGSAHSIIAPEVPDGFVIAATDPEYMSRKPVKGDGVGFLIYNPDGLILYQLG